MVAKRCIRRHSKEGTIPIEDISLAVRITNLEKQVTQLEEELARHKKAPPYIPPRDRIIRAARI